MADLAHPLPKLREAATRWLLLFALALQAFAWANSSGYQLADSVEFMDRAFAVARGETLDTTGAVRSFGFSTFLLPFFALAEWLQLEDMRWVVHAVRFFQVLLGLGLVLATTRLGALLGGRQVGLVAGYLVAINPTFLQYSTDPVSGIAAALFIALGLNVLLVRRGLWPATGGGLLLGLAFMMAYQTILISVPLIALLVLRDRLSFKRAWLGAALGMTIALGIQVVLDKLMYDAWGVSIRTYLIENMGGVSVSFLIFIGLEDAQWVREFYESYALFISEDAVIQDTRGSALLEPRLFYLLELPRMLVWPVILFALLGLSRAWLKMNWKSSILVLLILINVYAMSLKGSKSFRLWLPLLPLLAPLCAWGWGALSRAGEIQRPEVWRRLASAALLLTSLVLGLQAFEQINTRRYGAYWEAMDYVNEGVAAAQREARERGEEPGIDTVGSAYNWAVFCRAGAGAKVVKFHEHLDQWHQLDEERRAAVLEQVAELDWLILHGTILRLSPELNRTINQHFDVAASFWEEDTETTIRDIRVLRRRQTATPGTAKGSERQRRLWELVEGQSPAQYRRDWQLDRWMPAPALFIGEGAERGQERLYLLGFEHETLPGVGFGWVTYHWYTDTGFDRDYVLVDRISTRACPWSWQNNREPAHGALPTSHWEAGTILRESYLMVPGQFPFEEHFKPLGGSYRRGDLLPASLWARGESPPPDIDAHRLLPADLRTHQALDPAAGQPWAGKGYRLPDGQVLSSDQLLLSARFLLPVAPQHRWPDDGRPGPDDAVILAELRRRDRLLARMQEIEDARGAGNESE